MKAVCGAGDSIANHTEVVADSVGRKSEGDRRCQVSK